MSKNKLEATGLMVSGQGAPVGAFGVQIQFSHPFWAEKFKTFLLEHIDDFIMDELVEKGDKIKYFMNIVESGFLSEEERKEFDVEWT